MGIIARVTSGTSENRPIPRRNVNAQEISEAEKVALHYFPEQQFQEVNTTYNNIVIHKVRDPSAQLDLLWKTSILFDIPRPSWAGVMQFVHEGDHQGQSYLKMSFLGSIGHLMADSGLRELLELIYAPNAVDHILSGKATSRAVRAHMIIDAALNAILYSSTLDVPLPQSQQSAQEVQSDMGQMPIQDEHGSDELRGPQTHSHDEHCSTDQLGVPLVTQNECIASSYSPAEITFAPDETIVGNPIRGANSLREGQQPEMFVKQRIWPSSVDEVCHSRVLDEIRERASSGSSKIRNSSSTAALWLQYMDMIDILRRFVKAERTANWQLHLQLDHCY
ncbi:predicted protein [Nematostella vectensis]|uniref:Uncharacterized protein n=1 Tax=Nematostella vectensis TaxID=45351 RepID=A7S6Y2_NEMVE|nr:predicted protein [Nematostella vectensis]|eukprot:XP_001632604.1 predicted protein [Nematostella vectensis]